MYSAKMLFVKVNENQEEKGRWCAVLMSHDWRDWAVNEIGVKVSNELINKYF